LTNPLRRTGLKVANVTAATTAPHAARGEEVLPLPR